MFFYLRYFLLYYFLISFSLLAKEGVPATYFSYTPQEIQKLYSLNSTIRMTKQDLQQGDQVIANATQKEEPSSFTLIRLYTYLYVAQSEAASLSYHIKGDFIGNLGPLSYAILVLFFPEASPPPNLFSDPYSMLLAQIVSEKVRERVAQENAQPFKFEVPKEKAFRYLVGLSTAKWIPWYAKPVMNYWPPPPPPLNTPFWTQQIEIIQRMQDPLTKEKKEIINFWAGLPDATTGDWRIMTNHYLFTHSVPLFETIQVRSLLAMGLYDGLIVGFSSKYYYLFMRPQEYDPSVHYEIPVPKHPSYPANHALLASIAATILSHFFPSEAPYWHQLAHQSGTSRIWAGIHYPIDVQIGEQVGKNIGELILKESIDSYSKNKISSDSIYTVGR